MRENCFKTKYIVVLLYLCLGRGNNLRIENNSFTGKFLFVQFILNKL